MPDPRRRHANGARAQEGSAPGLRPIAPPRPDQDRRAAIARVLPLWPHEIEDTSQAGRHRILTKLRRALRAERRRGVSGHWSYDLARHVELLRIYRLELAAPGPRSQLEVWPAERQDEQL